VTNKQTKEQQNLEAALESGAVQAFAEGKQIQHNLNGGKWTDYDGNHPNFTCDCQWRVKPEPEPLLERWYIVCGQDDVVGIFRSLANAEKDVMCRAEKDIRIVHMREVWEEENL
jgi:hypothetical protein